MGLDQYLAVLYKVLLINNHTLIVVYIHLVEHSHSRIPVPSTFGPPSRVADGKTPLRENPEFCGMSAIASMPCVPAYSWIV